MRKKQGKATLLKSHFGMRLNFLFDPISISSTLSDGVPDITENVLPQIMNYK